MPVAMFFLYDKSKFCGWSLQHCFLQPTLFHVREDLENSSVSLVRGYDAKECRNLARYCPRIWNLVNTVKYAQKMVFSFRDFVLFMEELEECAEAEGNADLGKVLLWHFQIGDIFCLSKYSKNVAVLVLGNLNFY